MKLLKLNDSQWLVTNKKYKKIVSKEWFDSNYWQKVDAIEGQSIGRGVTYFFNHQDKRYVLREYRRGGLVGKFVENKYLFNNLKSTRAYQEFDVLKQLRKLKLPVPKPVAALITVRGLNYRAKIITRLIKNADDLFHYLKQKPLSSEQWIQVGELIRRFHLVGLYHADLNIHNIMLQAKGDFWLIDFDKARFIDVKDSRLEANLERLLRSLRKEKQKQSQFHWQESDWAHLLQGYAKELSTE